MKAVKVFGVDRIYKLESGVRCRLHMDLFDVGNRRVKGLFLGRYRLSWIFFEIENPRKHVLVDCHCPFGVHVHFDDGARQTVDAETLDDVLEFFTAAIKNHFGAKLEL